MDATFSLESVTLRVADLSRSRDFYAGVLGLTATEEPGARTLTLRAPSAESGAPALLTLIESPGAVPKPPTTPGLFHVALLVPDRPALARVLRRLAGVHYPIQGASDHGVSEAVYLEDPDGNGLELYADRPRAEWPFQDGKLAMFTAPLDFDALFATAGDDRAAGLPAGTRIGHVHLRASTVAALQAFYTQELGLTVVVRYGAGAVFLSADGYHHHIGVNVWGGPATPRSERHAGLLELTVARRGLATARTFTDPDGLRISLVPL